MNTLRFWVTCGVVLVMGVGAQAAPREATTRVLDATRARWNEPALLEVWLNGNRGVASDRDRNLLSIGDAERLRVTAQGGGHLTLVRVDSYGDVRPFLATPGVGATLSPATVTTFPPDSASSARRPPTGSEDIYAFLTPEPLSQEALWADLPNDPDSDSSAGPIVAERIRQRLDAMASGSVIAARVQLRVAGRTTGTRGEASDADYSAEDIADYFAAVDEELATRGGFVRRRYPGLIHFVTGGAELSTRSKANLGSWIEALTKKMPAAKFVIEGHTDSRGSDPMNDALSKRRADSVMSFLVSSGVAAERLKTEPHGKRSPMREGTTDDALAENRRVDFRFVSMK